MFGSGHGSNGSSGNGWDPLASSIGPAGGGVDHLAAAAVARVQSGMIVGLGTGRTANRAIRALAERIRVERLDIDCVASSLATQTFAQELRLPLVPFDDVEQVDYAFDGAAEVDTQLRMLKGHHGALTRQRLIAAVSKYNIYMAGEDKVVPHLGAKALLAVTIIPFGITSIRNRLRDMGLSGVVRRTLDGETFMTDGGGVVLDIRLSEASNVEELAMNLDHVAGVVDHGLFLDEADEVLVESKSGEVRRLLRPEPVEAQ
jgi:ribose 5-phosphate isomerase A